MKLGLGFAAFSTNVFEEDLESERREFLLFGEIDLFPSSSSASGFRVIEGVFLCHRPAPEAEAGSAEGGTRGEEDGEEDVEAGAEEGRGDDAKEGGREGVGVGAGKRTAFEGGMMGILAMTVFVLEEEPLTNLWRALRGLDCFLPPHPGQ